MTVNNTFDSRDRVYIELVNSPSTFQTSYSQLDAMSSMPYAMRLVQAEKQRQSRRAPPPDLGEDSASAYRTGYDNPTMYSSKMMTSIWGMYNKYSVHNFKSKQSDVIQQSVVEVDGANAVACDSNIGGTYSNSQADSSSSSGITGFAKAMVSGLGASLFKYH